MSSNIPTKAVIPPLGAQALANLDRSGDAAMGGVEATGSPSPSTHLQENEEPSFHLFLSLPTEVRLAIWEYARPGPRAIIFDMDYDSNGHIILVCFANKRSLSLLWTNREARERTLKV
ncbi:hypothetical protein B0O99DRAFT_608269 [Bisporella sp. PMI_857]|nr:hypothetical protein B0O99DRAFT_608269 [Bisporella sp. PMI_857]